MKKNPHHIASSGERYTPVKIIEAARKTMRTIDLDPASCAKANTIVKATEYYSPEKGQDGLDQYLVWSGNNIFINPPGSCPKEDGIFSVCGNKKKCSCGLVGKFWDRVLFEHKFKSKNFIWIGFTMNQLQSLQKREMLSGPTSFPMCIPDERICFLDENLEEMTQPSHANYISCITKDLSMIKRFIKNFRGYGEITLPNSYLSFFS